MPILSYPLKCIAIIHVLVCVVHATQPFTTGALVDVSKPPDCNAGQEVSAGKNANLPPDYLALLQTNLLLNQHATQAQQHTSMEGQKLKDANLWKHLKERAMNRSMHKANNESLYVPRSLAFTASEYIVPQVQSADRLSGLATSSSSAAPELHSTAKQIRIFINVAAVLAPMIIIYLWQHRSNHLQCSPFLLAGLGCVFFGVDNFLIDYSASYLHEPSAHMCMMFLLVGIIAFSLHIVLLCCNSCYKAEWHKTVSSSWGSIMLLSFTGIFIAAAQLCGNFGFTMDQAASGPNQAIVCATALIVSPFFYCYCGEVLTLFQLLGCMLIVVGVVVMSDVSHWGDPHSRAGFVWLLVSTIFYAASIISWRIVSTGDGEVPWRPRLLFIFGTMGVLGCSSFCGCFYAGGFKEYIQTPALMAWPLLNAIASFLGMWCVNLAFQSSEASAGALTAIVDSNAVVLLVLNRILLSMEPDLPKVIGMILILIGCIGISCFDVFLAPSQPESIDKSMCDGGASFDTTSCGGTSEGAQFTSDSEEAAEDGSERGQ